MKSGNRQKRGSSTIAMSLVSVSMIGALGLAIDVGRMFITKNESQAFCDSASIAAALELDGSVSGLSDARAAVSATTNRWNLGTSTFVTPEVMFSQAATGPWEINPLNPAGYRYVRVTTGVNLPAFFAPVVGSPDTAPVGAQAIAGQVQKTTFREGAFPFSPLAHDNTAPHFGLTPGEQYTLRWAANPRMNRNTCAGDNHNSWINAAEQGGGSERGYIEETSASIIREAIEGDYMTRALDVGDSVIMTGGAKNTQGDAIQNRIAQDSDSNAQTFAGYNGNGRRIVVVPINTYHPNYTVMGFAAFFLLTSPNYNGGGNDPFCAEYIGPFVQGSKKKGAGVGGAYTVRLVN